MTHEQDTMLSMAQRACEVGLIEPTPTDQEKPRIRTTILELLEPTIDKAVAEVMDCRYRTKGTIEAILKAVLGEGL